MRHSREGGNLFEGSPLEFIPLREKISRIRYLKK